MSKGMRVCLLVEGSYPFITGGVSSWVHQLIQQMPEVEFVLFTISPEGSQELRYQLPPNVVEHRDIILSRAGSSRKKARNKKGLLQEIQRIHVSLDQEFAPELKPLLQMMPEGYFMHRDALASPEGWQMIARFNHRKNPVYPFTDYFWAWKASHDMLFNVLGAALPEADLYHAVSTGYAGLAGVGAKIRRGKPFVLTEHGLYHKEREIEIRRVKFIRGYQRDMWAKIYNSLSRMSYHYADLVIALFEYNRRIQLEMGAPPEKTRVIPNGIDVERYSAVERVRREGFHVGLVGRMVPIKDIKTFITCAKIVSEQIPEARFYCIGPTDEDKAYFEDCQILVDSFGLADRFTFTGRQDVREYYAFLDAVLLTSVREAQPLVILEAYCVGLPVVATNVGNIPELLDFDERLLASPRDAEKLARGVKFIHDAPEQIETLRQHNREKVLRFYDRSKIYRTYREIYESFHEVGVHGGNRL